MFLLNKFLFLFQKNSGLQIFRVSNLSLTNYRTRPKTNQNTGCPRITTVATYTVSRLQTRPINKIERVSGEETFLILIRSIIIIISSFNPVLSSSPKVAGYTSFLPRSLSHLPSVSFDLQLSRSSTRLSSCSLQTASFMPFLAVLAFAAHQCSL